MTMTNLDHIWRHFQPAVLADVCQMHERAFPKAYDMQTVKVSQKAPADFYAFRDNGASVLAVAHLDTVAASNDRACSFVSTAAGPVVFSRALDDRLGAYLILDMLPRLGIETDVLLTTGEETGQSTASFFDSGKSYDWIIEFDRGGTDVVMYQYDDKDMRDLVEESGAKVGDGIFSDICELDHLGVKAFNWGVGYREYHSARSHAYLDDTFEMLSCFMDFYAANEGRHLPHLGYFAGKPIDEDDEIMRWWHDQYMDDGHMRRSWEDEQHAAFLSRHDR